MKWKRRYISDIESDHFLGVRLVTVKRLCYSPNGELSEWDLWDRQLVKRYASRMKTGKPFTMINVFRWKNHWCVADGNHRLKACKRLGLKKIPVCCWDFYYMLDSSVPPHHKS